MLSRWRRANISDSALNQTFSSATSFVERKIHPDINSLAEELASASLQHGPDLQDSAFQADRPEFLDPDIAGFVGLRPSTTRRAQREGYVQARTSPTQNEYGPIEAGLVHIEAYNDIRQEDQKEEHRQSTPDIIPSHPSDEALLLDDPALKMVAQPIIRRSTFGRRSRRHYFDGDAKATQSASSSSSSLSQSLVTCPSGFNSLDQPDTPGSQPRSLYASTPRSRSNSSRNFFRGSGIPSPHTFGMSTPPLQHSSPKETDTYFTFKEAPPPLPPLDHPAFQNLPNAKGVPSSRNEFPHIMEVDEHGRFTRHTHSLPSLTRSKSATRIGSIQGSPKSTRPRSKSTVGTGVSITTIDRILAEATTNSLKSRTHSRNQSKSSIASSSRRSSAEYSAKQVSLIGDERVQDGCWEVQVSKEMIRLALGEDVQRGEGRKAEKTRDAQASAFGRARLKNRWTGEASRLGSPFFLQGPGPTHSYNLTDQRGSNDTAARIKPNSTSSSPRAFPEKSLRQQAMSHGGSTNPRTGSSSSQMTNRGKEASEGASSHASGSISRRGGARATSAPSSKPPVLMNLSSLHDQSLSALLVPPSLSVTSPTPEASPSSPSRRTHVKSSPTTPTTSVLRTPSKPPVIEKSYSSGSGKRKADEAGVGGDKTPPKEQKEPRATFAPDPRTHRASGTSSTGHAPSSYNRSKRVRLTSASEGRSASSRSGSRTGTLPPSDESPYNAKNTGSWSSRGSFAPAGGSSYSHAGPPVAPSASHASHYSNTTAQQQPQSGRPPSRRSLSQASIPISALISPHAPSVTRTGTFHMRDPRKPPPIQSTPWTLSLPSHVQEGESRWAFRGWVERGGSPLHAWLFFIGFVVFPVWWAAALFIPIPKTRHLGGTDAEKAVMLDDPQVEHDAKSWRTRCRVMAALSLITYIPFIVLVAIYA